jgi:4-hydroxymandelate oxidase
MENQTRAPAVNVAEYEALAKEVLPRETWDHLSGGAGDEITLRDNVAAFQRIKLMPRVLRDVTRRDLGTTVLGQPIEMPVLLAPVSCPARFHPDGELAVARAAGKAGTIYAVSTGTCFSIEEIAQASHGPLWFQLYAYSDRAFTQALIERAQAAGCKALCLTVDAPVDGRKERDRRNRYNFPLDLFYKYLGNVGFKNLDQNRSSEELLAFAAKVLTVALTWDYLSWIRSVTPLPLLLKGVLSKEDARQAASFGVEGIVVSNHGGRQLDGSPATVDVLGGIVDAVDGRAEILLDGGVRRGTDVL